MLDHVGKLFLLQVYIRLPCNANSKLNDIFTFFPSLVVHGVKICDLGFSINPEGNSKLRDKGCLITIC